MDDCSPNLIFLEKKKKQMENWVPRRKRDGGEEEKDAWRENSERRGGAASAHVLRMCLHDSEGPQHDTMPYSAPRTSGGVCGFFQRRY